ncbi:MAG: rhomboid family intramembrane serine protease [Lautropia sp.]|nr:rhomboid family intramembrane serine protease [Lautropia sp.]
MPPFIRAVLLINTIFFLLQLNFYAPMMYWFALWPSLDDVLTAPWQLVTYSVLHGDFSHLLFNMFAVWMFGSSIEQVWGARRTAITYLAAVVCGALTQCLVGIAMPEDASPVIGASAGVFGILLTYALLFPRNRVMLLIPPIPLPAPVFVGLYAILELWFGLTGTQLGIAHFAHLGGLLGGWIGYRYCRR